MPHSLSVLLPALVLLVSLWPTAPLAAAEPAAESLPLTVEQTKFYMTEVKPILVANCFKCHGEEKEIKGGLQLTNRAAILTGGDAGPAVDLADPNESVLLSAINYDDYEMPPKGKLPPAAIGILTKWVAMGVPIPPVEEQALHEQEHEAPDFAALIRDYWAYQPLHRPASPTVQRADWPASPIDAFVLAKLEEKGLSPSKPADKRTLMRRAYYDLTGLPPTPEEFAQFLHDDRPQAYSEMIDRLLDSPHYGEKWGRHWLDLVRYAETHGYERDSAKPFAWRYRDYVIQAFNNDKPYDQFLLEQLAGDELAEVTAETLTATGYYRLGVWDDEPADREQLRFDVLDDIVSTTSQVMLGMSIGCARCHDHKKDPIPQTDYYRMLAVFRDITDMNRENLVRILPDGQQLTVADAEKKRRSEEESLAREILKLESQLSDAVAKDEKPSAEQSQGTPVVFVADSRQSPQDWRYSLSEPTADWIEPGFDASAWQLAPGGFGNPGTPASVVRTAWKTSDIWLHTTFLAKQIPKSLTLTIHHDEDVEVYLNGERIFQATGFLTSYRSFELPPAALNALVTGRNVFTVHCHQSGGGQYIDVGLAETGAQAQAKHRILTDGKWLLGEKRFVRYQQLQTQLANLKESKPTEAGIQVMAVSERGTAETHVLVRGNPHVPGDRVVAGVPLAFGGRAIVGRTERQGNEPSGRRLEFARWLVSDENPMAARALANRLWQFHFGRAIVPTPNDFGLLGESPTHPELLDWLATEIVARGWRLKEIHKLMMLSSAYRMSSADSAAELAVDPANELYWRFPMRRLTAEEIRDSILAINGTLSLKRGGPSVYPEMPAAVLATASRPEAAWGKSPPEEQNRRSVYVFVKRSLIHPMLANFDLADTDSTCAVRFTTTVPTQSLAMLNSEFASQQAEVFAERLRREASNDLEAQVRRGLTLVLCRPPTDEEVGRGVAFVRRLTAAEGDSAKYGLRAFCLLALNLNEFVYLD